MLGSVTVIRVYIPRVLRSCFRLFNFNFLRVLIFHLVIHTYRELSRYDREPSFPEKKGYVPDVKLEYVDDKGHLLTTKEVLLICVWLCLKEKKRVGG